MRDFQDNNNIGVLINP